MNPEPCGTQGSGRQRNDLLFCNWIHACFVVVELKIGRFEPEHVGKTRLLRVLDRREHARSHPAQTHHGILLGAGHNDNVVRYSLAGTTAPTAASRSADTPRPRHQNRRRVG
jgi:hypothetical protein